jgi:hypothetical protein
MNLLYLQLWRKIAIESILWKTAISNEFGDFIHDCAFFDGGRKSGLYSMSKGEVVMRILEYATPRRLRTDARAVLTRLAMFVGACITAYLLIWLLVRLVVVGMFKL